MQLESKVINGLERLSDVLKSLLWEKAKTYGISPIQIQILLFVSNHQLDLCNVSYLAKEFNVSKPTISDAVKVLVIKGFLSKDFSPSDNRRYNLILSPDGKVLVSDLSKYSLPILVELEKFKQQDLIEIFESITKLIYQLNQKNIIQVQRTCFNCKYYSGNKSSDHFCNLMNSKLISQEIRLDCQEFEHVGS